MSKNDCPCETLWYKDPKELFRLQFTTHDICQSNNFNAVIRTFTLAILLGFVFLPLMGWIPLAFFILIAVFLHAKWLYATPTMYQDKEGFENVIGTATSESVQSPPALEVLNSYPGVVATTRPKPTNPFMNVLLDEIKYNPTRPAAAPVDGKDVQDSLDDFFRVQWTSDPTDVFGKSQSQREFYTMPSTSIPNDQESYQNWLYLIPGKTCKEGNRDACVPGTNGGAVPWLSQPN